MATPGSIFVITPVAAIPAWRARYMVAPEAPRYGIAPARPKMIYGVGTAWATAFVIPS